MFLCAFQSGLGWSRLTARLRPQSESFFPPGWLHRKTFGGCTLYIAAVFLGLRRAGVGCGLGYWCRLFLPVSGADYFWRRCRLFLPVIGDGAGYWCRLLVSVIFGAVPAMVPVTVPAAVLATVPVTVPVIGAGYFSGREIIVIYSKNSWCG